MIDWSRSSNPDIAEARRIVCEAMHPRDSDFCAHVRAGLRDDCPEMRIALRALEWARERPTEETKP
jgi:hypothetical protein